MLEISTAENIESRFESLKSEFDIIIIEGQGLNSFNKSKEWIQFSEKVLTVFESGRKINFKKKQNVLYLNGLEGKFIGWILNKDQNETLVKPKKKKRLKTIFSKNIELQWA